MPWRKLVSMTCTLMCLLRGVFTSPLTALAAASTLELFSWGWFGNVRQWVVARLLPDAAASDGPRLARIDPRSRLRSLRERRRND